MIHHGPTERFDEWRDPSEPEDYRWFIRDRLTGETAYVRGERWNSGEAGRAWKSQCEDRS